MTKILFAAGVIACSATSMATMFFNSSSPANNATTRADFLAAAGVASGDYFQDFESYDIGTNMIGVDIGGGVLIGNSGTGVVEVRGDNAFGGSDPIDTRGLWHNESQYLELDFTGVNATYVGGFDIDHTGGPIIVTYTDDTTENFSLESTGGSGASAEFWGLVTEDGLLIKKLQFDVGGDNSWGLDNLEYGVVPEPATMTLLGLGAAALIARRKKKS